MKEWEENGLRMLLKVLKCTSNVITAQAGHFV